MWTEVFFLQIVFFRFKINPRNEMELLDSKINAITFCQLAFLHPPGLVAK